ncbi:MAG: AsmA family protein [Magnetococcales bacterium]|nr:AsmA family protein [Magnetococcales bacterium]
MAKPLRFIIISLLSLLALLVIGVGGALFLVDPNAHKAQIAQLVESQTGRRLVMQDDFALSFFPWVGVRLGALELGNAAGFGPGPFAKIASANLRVKLLPLLQHKVEVDTITVQGLHLNLETDSRVPTGNAGANNWSDLARLFQKKPSQEPQTPLSQTPPELIHVATSGDKGGMNSSWAGAIAVGGLHLLDAHLSWRDVANNTIKNLVIPELTSGPLQEEQPVPLTLQLRLEQGGEQSMGIDLSLQGSLQLQVAAKALQLNPLHLRLTAEGKQLPTGKATLETTLELALNWQTESLQLTDMQLTGAGLKVSGRAEGQKIFSSPRLAGTLTLLPVPVRDLLQQWGVTLPQTRDPKAFATLDGEIPFTVSRENLALANMQLRMDGSLLTGQLTVQNFVGQPSIQGELLLDSLDLDRYRAATAAVDGKPESAPPARQSTGETAAEQPVAKQGGLPVAALRALDLQGRLRIKNFRAANLSLQEVALVLESKKGLLHLTPAQAHLYQGTLWMDLLLNVQGEVPQMSLDGRLDKVQAGDLLQDWNGHDPVNGLATVQVRLNAVGDSPLSIKKNLNGTTKFSFQEGAIKGVDIAKLLEEAAQALEGQAVEPGGGTGGTRFTTLNGSATVKNGVLDNRDLAMLSPLFRIQGAGTVNLPADRVEYQLQCSVTEALQGKGGRTLTTLTGVTIPIQVSGPLENLSWRLDLKTLLEQGVAQKAKEKLGDKIQDKATELLKKQGLENLLPADVGKRLLNGLRF